MECLGEFDMEIYQLGFFHFLEKEIFITCLLNKLTMPFAKWWVNTFRNDQTRELIKDRIRFYMQNKK